MWVQFLEKFPDDKEDVEKLQDRLEYIRAQVQKQRDELITLEKDLIQ